MKMLKNKEIQLENLLFTDRIFSTMH